MREQANAFIKRNVTFNELPSRSFFALISKTGSIPAHDIAIPDERFDMLEAAATQADEMESRLNEEIEKNVALTQQVNELSQNEILLDVASDLADTEVEKFSELAESVEYENADDYRLKLETIKDSYFPKAMINEEVEAAPNYEDVEMSSGKMAAYLSAIGRVEKRANG